MDSIGTRTAKSAASDGNTLVGRLRKKFGKGFAAGYPEIAKQSEDLLPLSQLRRDQEIGSLGAQDRSSFEASVHPSDFSARAEGKWTK
jgi:hypothetical protein